MRRLLQFALLFPLLSGLAFATAQANQDPAVDVLLSGLDSIESFGRVGTYPNGVNGVALRTTVCNLGSKPLPWMGAMNPSHPFIAFLVVRQSNGRFEQISDRSFVKHGFFAAEGTRCGPCQSAPGQIGASLGIGCSDTYDSQTNADRFYLGPADEIDPWAGTWDPNCSYFDRGEPAAAPPLDCDGRRSLTKQQIQALGPVAHRITLDDAALNDPNARYFAQAQYVVEGEPEPVRFDDLASRRFTPEWNGSSWDLPRVGGLIPGTVLNRWFGATVTSGAPDSGSGATDGRVYVGLRVTGPVRGLYHYEYALHNRDHRSGIDELRIPVCAGARVFDPGSRDIDADPNNDWTASRTSNEITFTGTGNPLRWNTIYNFWFDSDAAPNAGLIALATLDPAAAIPSFEIDGDVPGALYNVYLDPGCGSSTAPELYAIGTPARASLGNTTFALESRHNAPGRPNLLLAHMGRGSRPLLACTLSDAREQLPYSSVIADGNGVAVHPTQVPASPQLEGLEVRFQSLGLGRGPGETSRDIEFSNGLRVRIGDTIPGCP